VHADKQSGANGTPFHQAQNGLQSAWPDCIVPEWPAPANVRAVCTTRLGGVSGAPYGKLNLGSHVGDDPGDVHANRQRLASWLSTSSEARGAAADRVRPVFMEQIHSTHIARLDRASADGIRADGALTSAAHLACTVMVADCLPVLLCNVQGTHVAAVHAGWRGLVGQHGHGVVEEAVSELLADSASSGGIKSDCMAWLGPCIGPEAFEVGDEVRAAFVAVNAAAQSSFRPLGKGKWLADLPALTRQRLQTMGVNQVFGNDGSPPWCTVANPSRFFSYRRDGITGRMAACIWRVD